MNKAVKQKLVRNNEYKISHLKGLQRTTPDGLGALASNYSTRTLCLPPPTFLFVWFRDEIHFAGVEGKKTTT
jgi:hypothetical protein